MVQNLSQTVILPIAGIVITYVLCVELIGMITDKNSLHDIDTFMFFKYVFKAWVAVYLVTHVFDITMAVFDVGQHLVNNAAGVINTNTAIDVAALYHAENAAIPPLRGLPYLRCYRAYFVVHVCKLPLKTVFYS